MNNCSANRGLRGPMPADGHGIRLTYTPGGYSGATRPERFT
jgi:hypothetical protein